MQADFKKIFGNTVTVVLGHMNDRMKVIGLRLGGRIVIFIYLFIYLFSGFLHFDIREA